MMKASAFEFRFRYLIHTVVYVLGFTTPWNKWLHLDTVRTWQWLAWLLARQGWLSFSVATNVVLVVGIAWAIKAAWLRTWGAAYLGSGVVQDASMHGDRIVAAGPYRYMRNPLYWGTFVHTLALALLMLPSGAIFSIVILGLFQLRLIGGEEAFLTAKLGEPYKEYCSKVPRFFPSFRPQVPAAAVRPAWGVAILGEIYFWGVAISFLVLGWRYNAILIMQGVLVSLGISLVARAFVPKPQVRG
ncbi:methyltransferase family protein [Edaphobacter flagellatus]|uniref:methyltransferase family protein n=1 Tax=Edaphobacter flagellatus TaxID=1933044 RepID=UPI0021B199EE|nr:isoprenylcysteine carboxylmethyltransferase family protein [Edaphobacter flagellatus]